MKNNLRFIYLRFTIGTTPVRQLTDHPSLEEEGGEINKEQVTSNK
jgi:hypothetical protein